MRFGYYRVLGMGLTLYILLSPTIIQAAAPTQQIRRIVYNEVVEGNITQAYDIQDWVFSGHTGDMILIDMQAQQSGLDTYLTLLDIDGNFLLEDDDGGEGFNSLIGPYTLLEDGDYTIQAESYEGAGAFTLEIKTLNTLTSIQLEKPLVGTVNAGHSADYYLLNTSADVDGKLWQLALSNDGQPSNAILALHDLNNHVLSTEEQENTNLLDPLALLPDKTYVIIVRWDVNGPGGPYELVLRASDTELLESGDTRTHRVNYDSDEQQRDYFYGYMGQTIRLKFTVEGDVVPVLYISNEDLGAYLIIGGNILLENTAITLIIPRTGIYMIESYNDAYDYTEGTYTIMFEVLND